MACGTCGQSSKVKQFGRLLVDMSPPELVRCLDFRYVTDALTPDEATLLLDANAPTRAERERQMREFGFPAYTIIAGAGLYVRRVRLPRTLAFASLNPFFPDSIQASLLKIIRRHDDSESTFALKVRNQGSARAGIFDASDISTIMTTPR